jgi:hypothetical protein
VTAGWRRLFREYVYDPYCSSNGVIKRVEIREGHAACVGVMRNAHKILVGKCE